MTQKRSLLRAAVVLLAVLLLSVFAPAAAETAEAPQQTVFVFDQDREMDLWQQDKTLRVFCIPVGAQDCYFITCEGHAMVLDCAGVGREPTPDFLFRLCDALGIDRLDFAFNTHPHRDHINGFAELLAKIPADEYLSTFPLDSDKYQRQLIHQLRELNIPIRVCEAGEALSLGGAQLETYRYMGTKNTNDRSMVVHIRYGERSILFTADIGLTAQRDLARENAGQFKSDILKLPHHGVGGISPDLLDAVSPELCFVSNGPTSHDVKLQKTAVLKRNLPLYFTSRVFHLPSAAGSADRRRNLGSAAMARRQPDAALVSISAGAERKIRIFSICSQSALVLYERICYNLPIIGKGLMKMISIYALETAASTAAATAADGTATTANAGLVEMLGMLLPLILMFVVFYFFLIRPQKKKDKKVKDMLAALKPGDRICTIGGIYGTIKSIKDDTIELSVGREDTKMIVARWAIRNVEEVTVENDGELLN